ncbi:MAG: hypothetical protein HOO06_11840 [Bdellovibrionaceae bacterium]|nr:hypothetical protein [Pseudobdellovibrionaceae bacterium]
MKTYIFLVLFIFNFPFMILAGDCYKGNRVSFNYSDGVCEGLVPTAVKDKNRRKLQSEKVNITYNPFDTEMKEYLEACDWQGRVIVSSYGKLRCFDPVRRIISDDLGFFAEGGDTGNTDYITSTDSTRQPDELEKIENTTCEMTRRMAALSGIPVPSKCKSVADTPRVPAKPNNDDTLIPKNGDVAKPPCGGDLECVKKIVESTLQGIEPENSCVNQTCEMKKAQAVAAASAAQGISSITTVSSISSAIMGCEIDDTLCLLKKIHKCSAPQIGEKCVDGILAAGNIGNTVQDHIRDLSAKDPIQKAERVADKKQCDDTQEEATQCCGDILACVTGKPEIIGQILSGVTQIANTARAGQINSIAKHCEQLKNISDVGTFTALASSGVCKSSRDTCKDTCEPTIDKYEKLTTKYNNKNCSSGKSVEILSWRLDDNFRANCKERERYSDTLASLEQDIGICGKLEQKQDAHVAQSIKTMIQGQLARDCEERVATQATGLPVVETAFNGDCTNPINATNPTCLFCREAVNRSSTQCTGLLLPPPTTASFGDNGGGRGLAAVGGRPELGGDAYNDDDGDSLVEGDVIGGPIAGGTPSENPGIGGGGTGGPQMSGDSGGGMGAAGGGGSGGGAGYKTNILRGARGGGGYTSNVAVSSGGGFKGYSRGGSGKFDQKKRFSLKDYLPSKKSKPKNKRSIAGLGRSLNSEIGGAHTDIFHRVSKRYTAICRLKRLLDCK